jgi:hypothetical protein
MAWTTVASWAVEKADSKAAERVGLLAADWAGHWDAC